MTALFPTPGARQLGRVAAAFGLIAAAAGPAARGASADGGPCIRRPLVAADGAPVRGAEDLAVDRERGRLYLSAYDRAALERVDAGGQPPQGALYHAPLAEVVSGTGPLAVATAVRGPLRGHPFHPHGIALDRDGVLTAVNHAYPDGASGPRTRLERFAPTPGGLAHAATISDAALCRSNDLAATPDGSLLVTRDHGACSVGGRRLEDLLGLSRGKVLRVRRPDGAADVDVAATGLAIPNGIAVLPERGRVLVAESRRKRIAAFGLDTLVDGDGQAKPQRLIAVDGGPDNLSIAPDGELLAAVHPSLWRFALARYAWFGITRAGSRVVGIRMPSGEVRSLLNAPDGALLAGSTAAVRARGHLLVSSVIDDALLVCS